MIGDRVTPEWSGGAIARVPAGDETDTAHVLIAHFRSMMIRRDAAAVGTSACAPAAAIARWLQEYQIAYFKANHVLHGTLGHELRGRSLTFSGDGHLSVPDEVAVIAEPALAAGMSLTFNVTLDALVARERELAALRERSLAFTLSVDCSALDEQRPADALRHARAALDDYVGRGGEVSLTGNLATLRSTGVLAGEAGNSTFIQIFAPLRHGLRPVHRRHDFAPCHSFFALNLDEEGDVYPCLGMLGHRPARLGSVHEPFDEILQALSASGSRIESLARRGPRIEAQDDAYPTDLCALHRAAVTGLAQL